MAFENPDPARERSSQEKSEAMSLLLRELATMPRRAEGWEEVLRPGQTVGRFELVSEIGRGGFGIVYEARDRELGRSVAFKAVRPGSGLEAGGELLLREAESIARLSHPNLVTLHDVGRCAQGPYLVLELLRGMTLGERLRRGPLPTVEALRVGVEVARGLAHAHAAGVTHRDLKPSNVFLCDAGHVKVLDFGMAHAFGRPRTAGGTPAYMAPEQWDGSPEDERTDVFALGVMLYQMLQGDVPLPEGGRSLEAGPAPQLSVPDCPAVGTLVARMLERDPADRPRDASEVLSSLVAFREALRTGEEVTSRFVLPPPPARRHHAAMVAAFAALALLVAGLLLARALRPVVPDPSSTPIVAVLPFTALSTGPDDASLAAGIHAELITQLTQFGGLRVIGRSSVQGLGRGGRRDLRALARRLGVNAIVEGTLQRAGDRLRIQAQLVDPVSGEQRWADSFDRRADDLFALQGDVALELARALGAHLTAQERVRAGKPPTLDGVAHQMYLRALYFWGRSSDDADRLRARELLAGAVARDQGFALAYAWLAVVETELANVGMPGFPFASTCASAAGHAARALALDAELPQAHGALAEVRWACKGDTPGALVQYEIQVRGAPGDGVALANLGYTRVALGKWEAGLEDLRAALVLEPGSYFVAMLAVDRMVELRQLDEAERACRRAEELSPGDVRALAVCAMIPFWRSGDVAPARATLDGMIRQLGDSNMAVAHTVDLFSLLPGRTLELAHEGRLPDPISPQNPFIPRALVTGAAHQALGHAAQARADFSSVTDVLEASVAAMRGEGDESGLGIQLLWLARAHAGMGRGEEALRETREALTHLDDVAVRTTALLDVAEIALTAGDRDEALRALAEALRSPGGTLTPAAAARHPGLAPLRGLPAFEALLSAHARPMP